MPGQQGYRLSCGGIRRVHTVGKPACRCLAQSGQRQQGVIDTTQPEPYHQQHREPQPGGQPGHIQRTLQGHQPATHPFYHEYLRICTESCTGRHDVSNRERSRIALQCD